MKLTQSLTVGLIACSFAGAHAGTPSDAGAVAIEESTSLGANISVGYDSDYIFRGVNFGQNSLWGQVDAEIELASNLSLDFGAWYETLASDQYDELDLWAGLSTSVGAVDIAAGFLWYYFPPVGGEGSSDTQEVFYSLGTEVAGIGFEFMHAYDFVPNGHYLMLGASKSFALTDKVGLDLGAGVSYNIDYFVDGDGWNNVDLRAGLPITLTTSATLTPYIAYSQALGILDDTGVDNYLYGGVSLSVSF